MKRLCSARQLIQRRIHLDEASQLLACIKIDDGHALARHHLHRGLDARLLDLLLHRSNIVDPDADMVHAVMPQVFVDIGLIGKNLDELELHVAQVADSAAHERVRLVAAVEQG